MATRTPLVLGSSGFPEELPSGDTLAGDRMEFQGKRQTVLSGETNSSGRADFLTYTGKTVTTIAIGIRLGLVRG